MNQFLVKITAVVLIGLLLITGLLCLIGFNIGGEIGLLHIALFFGLSIIVGGGGVTIIYHDSEHRDKFSQKILGLGIALCMLLFWNGYGWLNTLSAKNEVVEYTAEVVATDRPYRSLFVEYVTFNDPQGVRCKARTYILPLNDFYTGDTIRVKERMGGFGYKTYEIHRLTNDTEADSRP